MNKTEHFANDFVMLVEDESLHSRIASLHFTYYDEPAEVAEELKLQKNHLQCVVGDEAAWPGALNFGTTQNPGLIDYTDGEDTLAFLCGLEK